MHQKIRFSLLLLLFIFVSIASLSVFGYWKYSHRIVSAATLGKPQKMMVVSSNTSIKFDYDVIVVGTDPEGIAAALSASRDGLKTLLVDDRGRTVLGGLMTEGWLNSIDLNRYPNSHHILNQGIFAEWYHMVEGDSFDIHTAANAFYKLVKKEKNLALLMQVKNMEPILQKEANGNYLIQGLTVEKQDGSKQMIHAHAVIDATQDADIAAVSHVPYTIGREDIGDTTSKMATTLIFRIKNVTPSVWQKIRARLQKDNNPNTGATQVSAWGYAGMYHYPVSDKNKMAMRGLNIGRQNDNTALINSLQLFGVDALDPKSREEAKKIAQAEIPHIVAYMQKKYPEFSTIQWDGTAPELYVRETRHIVGEYRLSIVNLLENKDQWDRIAFGSYPVDIQRMSPKDYGIVVCKPIKYAIPFRSVVPLNVDGLLVVGRSASFDSIPSGSARTIPVGMAVGEAAGVAAKVAIEHEVTFRQMSASKAMIQQMQDQLNKQGMDIHPYTIDKQTYEKSPSFSGLKFAASIGFASGGYRNNFHLDDPVNSQRMIDFMRAAMQVYPVVFQGDPSITLSGVENPKKTSLTLDQASFTVAMSMGIKVDRVHALKTLQENKLLTEQTLLTITDKKKLTSGNMYMLLRDVVAAKTGQKW